MAVPFKITDSLIQLSAIELLIQVAKHLLCLHACTHTHTHTHTIAAKMTAGIPIYSEVTFSSPHTISVTSAKIRKSLDPG